jgi:hypothetical protein
VQQRLEFSFARCLGGRVARLRHALARGLEKLRLSSVAAMIYFVIM